MTWGKNWNVSATSAQHIANIDGDQFGTIIYIILGVLGALLLGGCAARVFHHEDKKKAREQLVPPGGGIGAGADEQATELQQAHTLHVEGFGGCLAETDLVHGV